MPMQTKAVLTAAVFAAALVAAAPRAMCGPQAQDQKPSGQQQAQPQAQPQAQAQSQQQAQPAAKPQEQQETDPLVEASRKAKANKPKTDTKKVYTSDDLSSSRSSSGVSEAGEKDSGGGADAARKALGRAGGATGGNPNLAGGGGASGGAAGGGGKGEAYWRARAQGLRDQMAQVDADIARLQDEIKKGGNAGFNVQSGLKTDTVYFEDRNSKLKRLEQKKAEIQKQIDALEDEARQADVPSSWIH